MPPGSSPFGPPEVGLGTVVQALAVLVSTATLAGLIPALHAASIKPIEALRTEILRAIPEKVRLNKDQNVIPI